MSEAGGNDAVALIVLAAGAGSRMRSRLAKPLHPVAGLPMVEHVLRAGAAARPVSTTLVVSPGLVDLADRLGREDLRVAVQTEPKGTGDAVRAAMAGLAGASPHPQSPLPILGEGAFLSRERTIRWVVVLYADHPLLTPEIVEDLIQVGRERRARVTVLSCKVSDAAGYGRIVRDEHNRFVRIAERADDDPAARMGTVEVNSGMMVLDAVWAREALARLRPSPPKGEYYLTDLVAMAVADGGGVDGSWPVENATAGEEVLLGVNDRVELARADGILRQRLRTGWMERGVTIVAPETVMIDADARIGEDTTILPFSLIQGTTTIGASCTIGPRAVLTNARIGDRVVVQSSTIVDSTVGDDADVGPYAHLRRGTRIGPRVHIGNYAELKAAEIDADVKVGHVSYLGDVHVGADANIGAGTITCNFDGVDKHRTEIGARAFIGSDTMLVAPVTIGEGARTGAGAVVTRDVPPGETVAGVPARPLRSTRAAGAVDPALESANSTREET